MASFFGRSLAFHETCSRHAHSCDRQIFWRIFGHVVAASIALFVAFVVGLWGLPLFPHVWRSSVLMGNDPSVSFFQSHDSFKSGSIEKCYIQ